MNNKITFIGINAQQRNPVEVPQILRGSWFSWEGKPITTVLDVTKMNNRYLLKLERNGSDYSMIFRDPSNCYVCIKAFTRYERS